MVNETKRISDAEVAKEISACRQVAEELSKIFEEAPTYYIETFGCQQNEADSQRLAGICRLCGYVPTDDIKKAKIILFNTCAIREHAEKKALSIIGETKHIKAQDF